MGMMANSYEAERLRGVGGAWRLSGMMADWNNGWGMRHDGRCKLWHDSERLRGFGNFLMEGQLDRWMHRHRFCKTYKTQIFKVLNLNWWIKTFWHSKFKQFETNWNKMQVEPCFYLTLNKIWEWKSKPMTRDDFAKNRDWPEDVKFRWEKSRNNVFFN